MRANYTINRRNFLRAAGTFVLVGGLVACTHSYVEDRVERPTPKNSALTVFATTGFIGDIVRNIAPDAEITVMVGPGGNPHRYEPTLADIKKIQNSDVVLWTSPQLESLLSDQLEAQDTRQYAVLEAITDADSLVQPTRTAWVSATIPQSLLADPHVWMSPPIWQEVVRAVAAKLIAADEKNAETYRTNEDIYLRRIDEAAAYVAEQVAAIPEDMRVLISSYDGFHYFGKEYGFEVHAAAGHAKELGDLVLERNIKTLFPDNVSGSSGVRAVQDVVRARGGQVALADRELLVGSLGDTAPLDSYVGALRYNADVIRAALEAKKSHT